MSDLDINELWHRVTELVLERSDRFGPLIQCMRAAVPITLDADTLVVGLSGAHQYLSGHLETPANRRKVTDALQQIAGKPLEFRLIEGTSEEDWKNVQEAERILRAKAERTSGAATAAPTPAPTATVHPPAPTAAGERGIWQDFYQRVHFAWQATPMRGLPVPRAQFLGQVLPWLADTEAQAAGQGESEDIIQRAVGRAIERVGTIVDLPPTAVALEFLRVRAAAPKPPPPKPAPRKPTAKKRKSK